MSPAPVATPPLVIKTYKCTKKVGPGWTKDVQILPDGSRRTLSWFSPRKLDKRGLRCGGSKYKKLCLARRRQDQILLEQRNKEEWIDTRWARKRAQK